MSTPKKQVLVLTSFALIRNTRGKDVIVLKKMLYIDYLFQFQNESKKVFGALINYDSELKVETPTYTKPLGIQMCRTNFEN